MGFEHGTSRMRVSCVTTEPPRSVKYMFVYTLNTKMFTVGSFITHLKSTFYGFPCLSVCCYDGPLLTSLRWIELGSSPSWSAFVTVYIRLVRPCVVLHPRDVTSPFPLLSDGSLCDVCCCWYLERWLIGKSIPPSYSHDLPFHLPLA